MKSIKYLLTIFVVCCMWLLTSCQKDAEQNNVNPEASFTYTSSRVLPVTVQFVNTSMIPGGQTATYFWNFGDGGTSTNSGTVSHDYAAEGVYLVYLAQHTSGGMRDTVFYAIAIGDPGSTGNGGGTATTPGPSFTYNIPHIATRVSFINTSTGADTYLWAYGDGATSTTDSTLVQHTYTAVGDYPVILRASSQNVHDTAMAIISVQ